MKVAYVMTHYPARSQTFLRREVAGVERLGTEVLRISLNRIAGSPAADLRAEAAATFTVKSRLAPFAFARAALSAARHPSALVATVVEGVRNRPPGLRELALRLVHLAEALVVWRQCARRDIRVLHAQFGSTPATLAWLACSFGRRTEPGWRWSFSVHGYHEFTAEERNQLTTKVLDAEFVVCVSQFTRAQLMRITPPETWSKLRLVRCGIDLEQFGFAAPANPSPALVVAVGRLSAEKGHTVLLDAVMKLRDSGADIDLTFVGDGPLREQLQARWAAGGGREPLVTGELDDDGVRSWLRKATVFCQPSFAEGIPISMMEAMAMGVPVVGTYVGGVPELARPGESATLVAAGDVDALAAALGDLVLDSARRERQARRARELVAELHDARVSARQMVALLTASEVAA